MHEPAARDPADDLLHPGDHLDHRRRHPVLLPLQPADRSGEQGARPSSGSEARPRLAGRPAYLDLRHHRHEPVAVDRLHRRCMFIVAIQRIPKELYEAAKVDGASAIRTFFSITIPLLREMTTLVTILTLSGAFLVFNEVDGDDRGRPVQLQPGARHVAVPATLSSTTTWAMPPRSRRSSSSSPSPSRRPRSCTPVDGGCSGDRPRDDPRRSAGPTATTGAPATGPGSASDRTSARVVIWLVLVALVLAVAVPVAVDGLQQLQGQRGGLRSSRGGCPGSCAGTTSSMPAKPGWCATSPTA